MYKRQHNESSITEAKQRKESESYRTSKDEVLNSEELAQRNRSVGANAGNQQSQVTETIVREKPKIGRNEKVIIRNISSGETKKVKYKQAEPLINRGEWVLND